jgi:hypothetical protein
MSTTFFTEPAVQGGHLEFSLSAGHAGWIMETLGFTVDYEDVIAGEPEVNDLAKRIAEYRAGSRPAMRRGAPTEDSEVIAYVAAHMPYLDALVQAAQEADRMFIYYS